MKFPPLHPQVFFSVGLTFTLLVFRTPEARAGSFALNEQSVSGLGVAYAGGAAQAEDASTIFFNPAGIALLDHGEIQIGGQYIMPQARFHNSGSNLSEPGTPFDREPLSGGESGVGAIAHLIPNLYLSQPVFRSPVYGDLSVGIGLSVPFGLETDYDSNWAGRYSALRTKLQTFDIQPTVAYRMFDRLSLGASLDIQYASARLSRGIDFGAVAASQLGRAWLTARSHPRRHRRNATGLRQRRLRAARTRRCGRSKRRQLGAGFYSGRHF